MFATLIVIFSVAAAVIFFGIGVKLRNNFLRQVRSLGYPTVSAYLRATPRSDAEKRDAVSLALTGLVLCLLGLVFPPLLLIGLFPLFYGVRKVAWASMGLGLVDDADHLST